MWLERRGYGRMSLGGGGRSRLVYQIPFLHDAYGMGYLRVHMGERTVSVRACRNTTPIPEGATTIILHDLLRKEHQKEIATSGRSGFENACWS